MVLLRVVEQSWFIAVPVSVPVLVPVLVPVPASVPDPTIFSRAFQVSCGITTRLIPVVHPEVLLFHPKILSQVE